MNGYELKLVFYLSMGDFVKLAFSQELNDSQIYTGLEFQVTPGATQQPAYQLITSVQSLNWNKVQLLLGIFEKPNEVPFCSDLRQQFLVGIQKGLSFFSLQVGGYLSKLQMSQQQKSFQQSAAKGEQKSQAIFSEQTSSEKSSQNSEQNSETKQITTTTILRKKILDLNTNQAFVLPEERKVELQTINSSNSQANNSLSSL